MAASVAASIRCSAAASPAASARVFELARQPRNPLLQSLIRALQLVRQAIESAERLLELT
jgi:hypothetical protein